MRIGVQLQCANDSSLIRVMNWKNRVPPLADTCVIKSVEEIVCFPLQVLQERWRRRGSRRQVRCQSDCREGFNHLERSCLNSTVFISSRRRRQQKM